MIPRRYEQADRACQEARLQMDQGKVLQPRRLLESALKRAPDHLPTRIALVELAIRESNSGRAVREAKRATSIALLRCREVGLGSGRYAAHPVGRLLLKAIHAAGHAHLADGQFAEAINAFAAVLQEDPEDSLGACGDLIKIFLEQGRPEGVVGLYRLGYTRGLNLIDVTLSAIKMGDLELTVRALIDCIETVPRAREAVENLAWGEEVDEVTVRAYLASRKSNWDEQRGARLIVGKILEHSIVAKTLDLIEEIDLAAVVDPEADLEESRAQLIANLRNDEVVQAIVKSIFA